MTTDKTQLTNPTRSPTDLDTETPFTDEIGDSRLIVDMSEHAAIKEKALRVELRRTRDPALGPQTPERKLVDKNYIIGLINPEDLPRQGEYFQMAYHSLTQMADFGNVDSQEPIDNLVQEGDCYYFTTSEGQWRLKILDKGN